MQRDSEQYRQYVEILAQELVPAMGCTEPIAIAYAGAYARKLLGCLPDRVEVAVSANILKNAKSVRVPNTGELKGVPAAVAAGVAVGDANRSLEVLAGVTEAEQAEIRRYLENADIRVTKMETPHLFDILITVCRGGDTARVRITDAHTNITLLEKNGEVLLNKMRPESRADGLDKACLNVRDIYDFAQTAQLEDVAAILRRQMDCNMSIAQEGVRGDWGARIGAVLMKSGDDVMTRARALAAAGSDARMSGCELPVVINSGSGNQGLAVSVPVMVYARAFECGEEKTCRALLLANLLAIYQKSMIGCLSAFCGAVSAGASAGAGISYLLDGSYSAVIHTLVNALAVTAGMICDGAKPSCAAKIAFSVEAGILGFEMYRSGQQFIRGDGIVANDVEATLRNVARLGKEGMRETDREIIDMMLC